MLWRVAADVVLVIHLAFVAFVVFGGFLTWRWPRVAVVQLPVALYGVIIEIAGFRCPLTPFEKWLRGRARMSRFLLKFGGDPDLGQATSA